jgi:hypothetical protein
MRKHWMVRGALLGGMVLALAGCNKTATTDTNASYKTTIDNYYQAHPECLWSQPKKFPVQAATSDDAKTQGYDALTDAGLLTRTTAEKKVMIIASKQVNNYDISPQGRSSWTQDPTQPGYGNFCYGHREVTAIDHADVTTNSAGAKTAQVNYHFKLTDMPGWAQSPEMQTAFPQLNGAQTAIQPAHTTLVMHGSNWQINK